MWLNACEGIIISVMRTSNFIYLRNMYAKYAITVSKELKINRQNTQNKEDF
jgi:hypothetical protein